MTQDLHDLVRVHIKIDQESGAGTPTVVDGDLADSCLAAAGFLAVSSGFGDQVGVVPAWRVDEGVVVSLGV